MSTEKISKIDDVVAELDRRINRGEYAAGQRLPAEREIAEELGVSRVTVRTALQRLQSENMIDVIPRGGAFVRTLNTKIVVGPDNPNTTKEQRLPHVGLSKRVMEAKGQELKRAGSFVRAMEAQGRQTLVRFVEPSIIISAGDEIGKKMEVHPDTEVLRRYRVHIVDRVPFRILDSYYLASLLGNLLGKDEGYIPLFKWLRDQTGLKATRAFEGLSCRMPLAEEAHLLNINRSQPIVDINRWVWADDDTLFEYSHIIANASLHEFTYAYDIDEEASR